MTDAASADECRWCGEPMAANRICYKAPVDYDEVAERVPNYCEPAPAPLAVVPVARCPVCDWPMVADASAGCVPDNCSYRPREGSDEWRRIEARRGALAVADVPRPLDAFRAKSRAFVASLTDEERARWDAEMAAGIAPLEAARVDDEIDCCRAARAKHFAEAHVSAPDAADFAVAGVTLDALRAEHPEAFGARVRDMRTEQCPKCAEDAVYIADLERDLAAARAECDALRVERAALMERAEAVIEKEPAS